MIVMRVFQEQIIKAMDLIKIEMRNIKYYFYNLGMNGEKVIMLNLI